MWISFWPVNRVFYLVSESLFFIRYQSKFAEFLPAVYVNVFAEQNLV